MKLFLDELRGHLHKEITLHFYEKSQNQEYTSSGSYTLNLGSIDEANNGIVTLRLTNNMNREAKSEVEVALPYAATYEKKDSRWYIEYVKNEKSYRIICQFPQNVTAQKQVLHEDPFIKDFKDEDGNVRKIRISIPEGSGSREQYNKAEGILRQIFQKWQKFTIKPLNNKPTEGNLDNVVYEYATLITVPIPGGVFFEIRAKGDIDDETIELGTDLLIDLKEHTITFFMDDIHYELRKATHT